MKVAIIGDVIRLNYPQLCRLLIDLEKDMYINEYLFSNITKLDNYCKQYVEHINCHHKIIKFSKNQATDIVKEADLIFAILDSNTLTVPCVSKACEEGKELIILRL